MNRYIPIIALAVAAVWPEGWAHADGNPACGPHVEAVKQLAEKFHESSKSQAITSAGTLLEVFRTEDGSTWTIVVTTPQGVACVVAAGKDWSDARTAVAPTQPEAAPQGYPGVGDNARLDPHKQFDIEFDF